MSTIHIERKHALGLEKAQEVADELAADLAEKFSITYGWRGDVLEFSRTGVEGAITVDAERVAVDARLGFLLFYLQPAIEQEIQRYLDTHFA